MKLANLLTMIVLTAGACVENASSDQATGEGPEGKGDGPANPIENVHAYDDCLIHGVSDSLLHLGMLGFRDPAASKGFAVTECITNQIAATDAQMRPYNLQSFKRAALQANGGRQIYFLKRGTTATSTNEPACLKVKLWVVVGATDVFVTIERVKQLPPPRPDGLCADNGET
jgi:hypothetical protein